MRRAVSLREASDRFLAALPSAPQGRERLPLAEASGRVLAADALAATDLPPFPRSLVDGFAVRVSDGPRLPLAGAVAMGGAAPALADGAAMAVPTGGMIPDGADAVVMMEDAHADGGRVEFTRVPVAGQHIVRRAADARAGDVVVPAGRRLRPSEIAMLAAAGVDAASVRARPRVAVLSTGDELVAAGAATSAGRVPDSNGPALCAALARDGADPTYLGIVADDRAAVRSAVERALQGHDALLCTGGSSVGERDYVQGVLAEVMGTTPVFSGIAIRPGRPTAAFVAAARWALALPGHAVSALVVYELLVREAVLRFGGESHPRRRGWVEAELTAQVQAPPDRDLFERIRLDGGRAVPLRGASATVGNLARADALLHCPAGTALPAGAQVRARLLE